MENVTLHMLRYREAARHLWNVFLKNDASIGLNSLPDHDLLDDWQSLQDLLFTVLVLRKTGQPAAAQTRLLTGAPILFLRVVPTSADVPAMISRTKPPGGYWDNPLQRLGPEDDLRFIDFFDWDQSGFLDFAYYRVSIRATERAPDLAGHEALIEVQYAHVFTDAVVP